MDKLSVVVSAFNSEAKIKDCLESVSWADEIIFVDNYSTDRTLKIAQKYTSKIFIRPNKAMLNINKNFGFTKATNDWILSLDSDERASSELKEEILLAINNKLSTANGYWIPRKNIIFGKWIKHTGWYPDCQLRLFKKGKGRFLEEHVHEMIKIEGKTEYLKNHIIHYNYETILQFLQKLGNIYAPNEAEQLLKNGYEFDWKDSIRFPTKEFLSRFFAREGYKDGFHGLMLSFLMGFYHFVVFTNIWERLKFREIDNGNLLLETGKEMRKSYRDLNFWFSKEIIKNEKNHFKKILRKLFSKIRN